MAGSMMRVPKKTKPKDVEVRRIFEKELDRALSWLSKKYRVPKPLLVATSIATVKRLGGKRSLAFTTNLREFALFPPNKKSTEEFVEDASGALDHPIIIVPINRRSPTKSMFALFHEFHHSLDIFEDPGSLYRTRKHAGWNAALEKSVNKKAMKDIEEYAKLL